MMFDVYNSSVGQQKSAASRRGKRNEEPRQNQQSFATAGDGAPATEAVANRLSQLILPANDARSPGRAMPSSSVLSPSQFSENVITLQGLKDVRVAKSYGTASGAAAVEVDTEASVAVSPEKSSSSGVTTPSKEASGLSKLFKGPLGGDFTVDTHTFARAQIRATFYPKFENEKSDQEVWLRFL